MMKKLGVSSRTLLCKCYFVLVLLESVIAGLESRYVTYILHKVYIYSPWSVYFKEIETFHGYKNLSIDMQVSKIYIE